MSTLVASLCAQTRDAALMLAMEPPAAVPAQAFAAPTVLTRRARDGDGPPVLAVNPAGHALVAWRDARGRVVVRSSAPSGGGAFGPPRRASRHRVSGDPSAALRADGAAAVAYLRQPPRGGLRWLEVTTARRGRAFERPQRLVSVRANVNAVHVLASGDRFVALWWQGVPGRGYAVRYAVSDARGRFGPVRRLARVDGEVQLSAAVDAAGTVLAAYRTPVLDGGGTAYATLAPSARRFGARRVLTGTRNSSLRAFSGPGGLAVGIQQQNELRLAALGATPRTIATVPEDPEDADAYTEIHTPVLALRGPAATVAAWELAVFPNDDAELPHQTRIDAALEQPDGTFSPPVQLSATGTGPQAAATATTAAVTFQEGPLLRFSLNLQPAQTLAEHADGSALAAAGDHVVAAWSSGRTIRIARLQSG